MRHRILLLIVTLTLVPLSREAAAGPRDRKLKKLQAELARLQRDVRQALTFRARYRNLRADTYFMEALNKQDEVFLTKVIKYLNSPVSIFDAFLSHESSNWERAKRAKNRYSLGRTTLWLNCRFGLQAVRSRAYYTLRIDVVDAVSGARIYQSLGPWQRRISRMITKVTVPIKNLRVRPGRYKLRISVEVSGRSVRQVILYYHGGSGGRGNYHRTPPRRGGDGIHTM